MNVTKYPMLKINQGINYSKSPRLVCEVWALILLCNIPNYTPQVLANLDKGLWMGTPNMGTQYFFKTKNHAIRVHNKIFITTNHEYYIALSKYKLKIYR